MSSKWARAFVWAVVAGALIACGPGQVSQVSGGSGMMAASSGAGGAGGGDPGSGGCSGEIELGPGEKGAPVCKGPGARFVTRVAAACFGPGQSFGQADLPGIVEGPPHGGGCCSASLDVCSLGNGGSITVAFEGNAIVDGPGPDFLVFENPFQVGGDPEKIFAELATVEVSPDGVSWHAFPCAAKAAPYGSCAGWHPIYANPGQNDIDPLDPSVAGGDPFDLADLGVPMARFVRITDRPDLPTVFDLDAVGIVNAACP